MKDTSTTTANTTNIGLYHYNVNSTAVMRAIFHMCTQYGAHIGRLCRLTVMDPVISDAFRVTTINDAQLDPSVWFTKNKDGIIKIMKAINKREKGNSAFSLLLNEITAHGDEINMDLMMDLLHQGPSTASLSHSAYKAHQNWKYPTVEHITAFKAAKKTLAGACARIILRDYEANFIIHQNPEWVANARIQA